MPKQRVGSARFVFESNPDNLTRTENFIRQEITTAFPGLRNANLGIAIYDEHDVLVRQVVFGNPSEDMRKLMDFEFGPDEPEVATG